MRLLQVGLGGWGLDWARRVLAGNDEVEVVGLVDVDPKALERARAILPVPEKRCYASVEPALDAVAADAMLITAALPAHAPAARAALEAGLDVLTEKPFATTLAEAREVAELAEVRGRTLMVSQNYRFFPAVRAVAELVRSGDLGAVGGVEIDFRRRSVYSPERGRAHRAYEQPLLSDMSIHHFDLLRLILGGEAREISCHAWNPPWSDFDGPAAAFATILFDGGVPVSYRGTWLSEGEPTPWSGEWRMEMERGEVRWTSRGEQNQAGRVTVSGHGQTPRDLELDTSIRMDRHGSLHEFVSAVSEGRRPESSGRENLGTVALMEAAVASAISGGAIALPAD